MSLSPQFGRRHNLQSSGATPTSVLRNYSFQGQETIYDTRDWSQVSLMQRNALLYYLSETTKNVTYLLAWGRGVIRRGKNSGFSPDSASLRNHSWQCLGNYMGFQGSYSAQPHVIKCPSYCTITHYHQILIVAETMISAIEGIFTD